MMYRCIRWMVLLSVVSPFLMAQGVKVTMGRFDLAGSEAAASSVSFEVRFSGDSFKGIDGGLSERHRLRIANRSPSAILMVVYQRLCASPQKGVDQKAKWNDCGTAKAYFHMGAPPQYQPIEPGRVRELAFVVSKEQSSEVRIVPISILFEDGSSIGKREPYTSKYLQMIEPMAHYFLSLPPAERAQLAPERRTRLKRISDTASAIASRSSQIEKDAGVPPQN